MTLSTLVYGASDDLIEVEGPGITEEFNAYDFDGYLVTSTGVVLAIRMRSDWEISVVMGGPELVTVEAPRGGDDSDEEGVPGYSARARLHGEVKWVALVPEAEHLVRSR